MSSSPTGCSPASLDPDPNPNPNPDPDPDPNPEPDPTPTPTPTPNQVLGAAEVELRTLLGDVEVHALELPLSRRQKVEGQLHLKLRWETGVSDWSSADEANARV